MRRLAGRAENKEAADDSAAARVRALRAIDERIAYLVVSLLRDVVSRGTASVAGRELQRRDIGGKTGPHTDNRDGWFSGFGGGLVATAWMGMDDYALLGTREYGATTALPIWSEFMRTALRDQSERIPQLPEGIATAMIDPGSGQLVMPAFPVRSARSSRLRICSGWRRKAPPNVT